MGCLSTTECTYLPTFFEESHDDSPTDTAEPSTRYCSPNDWNLKDPRLRLKLQQAIKDNEKNEAFWEAWQYTCKALPETELFSPHHAELLLRRRKMLLSQFK